LAKQEGFEIIWMEEEDEEPVTLFFVSTRKI